MNPSEPGPTARPTGRSRVVVTVLALSGIVVSLMHTVVIPLIPRLPGLLGASAADTTWAITATLLSAAVATPMAGRLGDMFGKRRLMLASLLLLVAGSVLGAMSETLMPLVIARALQGMASGAIPLGISIMRDELPPERLGTATALMSASLGVGGALGLPLAALLAEMTDWHVLFWLSAGLGVLSIALVGRLIPASTERTGGRFDFVGAAGLSVVLTCLLLGISKGPEWGWTAPVTLALFSTATIVLFAWRWFELRHSRPLVDLRALADRQVLLTNIASVAFGFSLLAMSLVLPQLLQMPTDTSHGLGQSIFAVGLVMAPSGLVMMAAAPVCARLSRLRGPRVTLMVSAVVVAGGYILLTLLMSDVWQLVLASSVVGAGIGLGYGAMPALIMGAVPISQTGAATSLNTLARSIGTSAASAVAGSVLSHMTVTTTLGTFPSQTGVRLVLALGAAAALGGLVVAAFLPRRKAGHETRSTRRGLLVRRFVLPGSHR